jgi:hypothetical protein
MFRLCIRNPLSLYPPVLIGQGMYPQPFVSLSACADTQHVVTCNTGRFATFCVAFRTIFPCNTLPTAVRPLVMCHLSSRSGT